MKWQDASEIVCGYVLKDKLNPDAVPVTDVYPSYQHLIIMKRDGAEKHEIVAKDFAAVDACEHAVERVNGTLKNPLEYLKILRQSALMARTKVDLEKVLKKMESGEDVTGAEVYAAGDKLERGYNQWVPMDEVEPQKVKFVKTGYDPLDKHVGGIPHACVTIIAGTPGIGKTTLGLRMVGNMLSLPANKKKKAAILSLEMTMGQIHQRCIELEGWTQEVKHRFLLNRIFNIHEMTAAVSELSAKEQVANVMIDFADLIVEGEQSESAMGAIYRNLELLATKTEVPIILICQLNRESYRGGLPKIHHIRYSGLAEATARLVLLTYNPLAVAIDFKQTDNALPPDEGVGYIIVGKSNFGFKEGFPGGIRVGWDGATGWGNKSLGYYPVQV